MFFRPLPHPVCVCVTLKLRLEPNHIACGRPPHFACVSVCVFSRHTLLIFPRFSSDDMEAMYNLPVVSPYRQAWFRMWLFSALLWCTMPNCSQETHVTLPSGARLPIEPDLVHLCQMAKMSIGNPPTTSGSRKSAPPPTVSHVHTRLLAGLVALC